jgi:phospholipid transport system substrate-binding protein
MKRCFSALAFCFGLLLTATAAAADRPTDQVKSTADHIIAILNDPKLKGEANKSERRRLIRQELDQRFDWSAICRGCLGHHWTKLSREQRAEFMDLFERFLERTYLDRIEPYYNDLDKIEYQGEKVIDTYASVKSTITTKEKVDHPVEYRLEHTPAHGWRVYDIVIEGVSLVGNYRTQFNEIITKSSYEALINDLRSKSQPGKS